MLPLEIGAKLAKKAEGKGPDKMKTILSDSIEKDLKSTYPIKIPLLTASL